MDLRGAILRNADLRGAKLRGADLSGADLMFVQMAHTDLSEADLHGALLLGTNLSDAILYKANLTKISVGRSRFSPSPCARTNTQDLSLLRELAIFDYLPQLNLSRANLVLADLEGASLQYAILNDAKFNSAILKDADMGRSNLTHADLRLTKMSGSILYQANLEGSVFEPESLPEINLLALANNLSLVTYDQLPSPLHALRKQFQEAGFRKQEREITFALMRTETLVHRHGCRPTAILDECLPYAFNTVLFDWTCHYGMETSRPLLLLIALWFVMGIVYLCFMHWGDRSSVYLVLKNTNCKTRVIRIKSYPLSKSSTWSRLFLSWQREWKFIQIAIFSVRQMYLLLDISH